MSIRTGTGVPVRTSDGVDLNVVEHGTGPLTVVLLHGWTLDHRLWRRQIADLPERLGAGGRDAGVRILAVDLRGHGRSGSPELRETTLDRLADDIHTVLRERAPEGPVVLAGHSLGGMAILEFAHQYPDVFRHRVAGVTLISTSAEGHTHTSYGLAPWLGRVVRHLETRAAALLTFGGTLRLHRPVMPALLPAVRWLVFGDRVEVEALRLTIAMIGCASLRSIGGFRPSVGRMNRVDALGALASVPVRLLVGSRDRLTPLKCTEAIMSALPQAELEVFDGCGHMLPLECPQAVTEALADVCEQVSAERSPSPRRAFPRIPGRERLRACVRRAARRRAA
jgi:pimeloyl-ACP methyl ester carboxylesterase